MTPLSGSGGNGTSPRPNEIREVSSKKLANAVDSTQSDILKEWKGVQRRNEAVQISGFVHDFFNASDRLMLVSGSPNPINCPK